MTCWSLYCHQRQESESGCMKSCVGSILKHDMIVRILFALLNFLLKTLPGNRSSAPVKLQAGVYFRRRRLPKQPLVVEVRRVQAAARQLPHREGVGASGVGLVQSSLGRQTCLFLGYPHKGGRPGQRGPVSRYVFNHRSPCVTAGEQASVSHQHWYVAHLMAVGKKQTKRKR